MKNILMLTWANLRKNKGQTVSLFIFMLIAAMLFNIGLALFFGIGSFFDERAEANHAAHFTGVYTAGAEAISEGQDFMKADARVMEIEELDVIGGIAEYIIDGVKNTCYALFSHLDEKQKMDKPSFIDDYIPLNENGIYLPYVIFAAGNFEIGDNISLNFGGDEMVFEIAGATEEIMFGSTMNGMIRFYISDEKYQEFAEKFSSHAITLLSARFKDMNDNLNFTVDYNKVISLEGLISDYNYYVAKNGRTMISNIVAIVTTVFAIILLVVSMILIRFRIKNFIEESMVNIGAQKAIGYRNIQVVSAIVIMFLGVALIGSIAGIAASQPVVPLIVNIMKTFYGLVWSRDFDTIAAISALVFILLMVWLISYNSARRINKLHPLTALRGGMTTHSFRKNYFPLDKTPCNLSFILSLKQLMQKKGQTFTIIIIVAAVSAASVAGVAVNYNMNVKTENFARTFFGEVPEIGFILKEGEDIGVFKSRMINNPEVRKTFIFDDVMLLIDEINISVNVAEDCALLEGSLLVSGRYPKHRNEIALGIPVLKVINKNIGDTVNIKLGDAENEYIITGDIQQMKNNGFIGLMTTDAILALQDDFEFSSLNVYLHEEVSSKEFVKKVEAEKGNALSAVFNTEDELKSLMDMFGTIFGLVAIGILTVTAFVVILVLYMVIKTTILNKRRELGIQKAVGFTTFQLMNQIALNVTPVILIGVVIGAVTGYFGLNPMMVALTSGMGIVRADLPMPLDQVIIVSLALVVLSYLVSMGIAWRIRKISAYGLISE